MSTGEDQAASGGEATGGEVGGGAAALLFGDNGGQQQEQQGQGEGGDKPFFGSDIADDPELVEWAKNKQFPDLKTALASQRNLEKLLGGDKVPLPKDENDVEGISRLHKALGVPESEADYALDKLEGVDPAFANAIAPALKAAGVSKAAAPKLAEAYNAYVATQTENMQKAFDAQSNVDIGELRTEWASNFAANVEHSRRAARVLGISQDESKAMELEIGTKRFLTLMSTIGRGIGEGEFIEGEGGGGKFGMNADQAKARIASLQKDQAWQTRYIGGGADEKAEWDRLHKVAYPERAA